MPSVFCPPTLRCLHHFTMQSFHRMCNVACNVKLPKEGWLSHQVFIVRTAAVLHAFPGLVHLRPMPFSIYICGCTEDQCAHCTVHAIPGLMLHSSMLTLTAARKAAVHTSQFALTQGSGNTAL